MSLDVVSEAYWISTTISTIRERCKFTFNNELLMSDVKSVRRGWMSKYRKNSKSNDTYRKDEVKVEPRFTFTFTSDLPYIFSILFRHVKPVNVYVRT